MGMNEKTRLTVNRVVALLTGGLLVFAVMSFTVVSTANSRIDDLTRDLDASRYEAGRLLANAEEQFAGGDYVTATQSLERLFQHQPGSVEAIEGRALLQTVRAAESAAEERWDDAMPEIRARWGAEHAAKLRMESAATRARQEERMDDVVQEAWLKAVDTVRREWISNGEI
jgi:hypothetical protein